MAMPTLMMRAASTVPRAPRRATTTTRRRAAMRAPRASCASRARDDAARATDAREKATHTTWITSMASASSLYMSSPARAEGISDVGIDAAPDPVVAAAFALAVVLLVVCTGGMGYIAFREALDRAEETKAREEEERQERVIAANKGKFTAAAGKPKVTKLTPSQIAAAEAGEGGESLNRRERRRRERESTSSE